MNVALALAPLAIVTVVGCGADSVAEVATPPRTRGCPSELLAGGFVRVSEDAASLVSQRAKGAVTPSLAADGSGGRFVVYREDVPSGNGEVVLRTKRAGDMQFNAPQNLSNGILESGGPVVAARDDLVAVAWLEGEPWHASLVLRTSVDGGRSFGTALPVSTDVTVGARPRIAILHSPLVPETASSSRGPKPSRSKVDRSSCLRARMRLAAGSCRPSASAEKRWGTRS